MERINRFVKDKINSLEESEYSFKSLYEIIHNQEDRIFAEYMDRISYCRDNV